MANGSSPRVLSVDVPVGPWSPEAQLAPERITAVFVTEGLLVREVVLGGVASSELLGPGDLAAIDPGEDGLLAVEVRWTAALPTRLAAVDSPALLASPQTSSRLVRRNADQIRRASVQTAIGHLPRVEDRVLAILWHLAERWGRVGPRGVAVPLQLTHEALGRLVGAARPTVSLALKELGRSGTVTRHEDGTWLLKQGSAEALARTTRAPARSDLRLRAVPTPAPSTPASPRSIKTAELIERFERLRELHQQNTERTANVLALVRTSRSEYEDAEAAGSG